ncbi:MAG: zinc-binding dehydrogenase [Actinobacteria bacterium]|nr:zinc-binding dehydrogenase [Actinomycetota bacterium]
MKALVKFGNEDKQVEIQDVPIPEISQGDVLLKVKAASICGWDIEMWRHKMANPVKVPVVQGHEFSGVIDKVGSRVTRFKVGDRVVSETAAYICGDCNQCLTGNYNLCSKRKGFGYGTNGAFTDFVKVPERCLHKIPDNTSFDHAALTEPACVAYNALIQMSRIIPGKPVLIIGPGPVGLFCLQIARLSGSNPIIVVGTSIDEVRFSVAGKLGADLIINVEKENVTEKISEITKEQGCDLVVDAAGNEKALKLAVDVVARMGQITKIGWGPKPINFSLDPMISKGARIQGTFSHVWRTWEDVLSLISRGKIVMEPMITKRISLDDWLETFEEIEESKIVKTVILFNRK